MDYFSAVSYAISHFTCFSRVTWAFSKNLGGSRKKILIKILAKTEGKQQKLCQVLSRIFRNYLEAQAPEN